MIKLQVICTACLILAAHGTAGNPRSPERLNELPLTELEQRLEALDAELASLADFSLRSGMGSVGYRSKEHETADQSEWVQINLTKETRIDSVVLVPSIWRDTQTGFRADGFPKAFRITAGTAADETGSVIASFTGEDRLLPRIAPLVVPCSVTASWIRVEASVLSPRAFDGKFNLELAEIMVFNGPYNVALRREVVTSSQGQHEGGARRHEFLVDGFMPYLMDAAEGRQSVALVSEIGIGDRPYITIDLGKEQLIDRVNLHTVDLDDTIPQSTPTDFGIPRHLVIEGAARRDFSDAKPLAEYRMYSAFDVGPILMLPCTPARCRYVRLVAIEPYIDQRAATPGSRIGFAEIELYSGARNAALGASASASFTVDNAARSFVALTDGRNLYGNILPIREWMVQLARRHELETLRPRIVSELGNRYARQKLVMRTMGWLIGLLAVGLGFTVLVDRLVRMRQISLIKERFAADLHDELGANLHTIGLLSDLAEASKAEPDELAMLHQRIRSVTERSGTAARHCTDLLEARGLYTDLKEDMERASQRIMAQLDHEIHIEGEVFLNRIPPRTRVDLFLFFKECLINIVRHSGATAFSTHLYADRRHVVLRIRDNGRGLPPADGNDIPASLKRRAHLLGTTVKVETPSAGGTCIVLRFKHTPCWKEWLRPTPKRKTPHEEKN